jgi:hypothetical protein
MVPALPCPGPHDRPRARPAEGNEQQARLIPMIVIAVDNGDRGLAAEFSQQPVRR